MSAPILRGPADAGSGAADAAAAAAADAVWLADAVRLATENVAAGGGPFGAVIVRDGALVAVGQNRVTRDNDPTAHAEVTAIRAACSEPRSVHGPGAKSRSSSPRLFDISAAS